jgi:hypothetical protein
MDFYVGLHMPSHAQHFDRCMISVNVIRNRVSNFVVNDWMMDSGAFTEIAKHGEYRFSVYDYAADIQRWSQCGNLVAAVAQDYMCEAPMLAKTGKTIPEHQALTIQRYDALLPIIKGTYVLPVLQGYAPLDYVDHLRQYGSRLELGAWVGVGSVCKRNTDIQAIEDVLGAIHDVRPDLRLHGFGIKITALRSKRVRSLLATSDSMAWSFAERAMEREAYRRGLPKWGPSGANDWKVAKKFVTQIEEQLNEDNELANVVR